MTVHQLLFSRALTKAPLAIVFAMLLNLPAMPQEGARKAATIREAPITEEDRQHWSFQPLVRTLFP